MPCYCTLCYPSSTYARSTVQKHLNKDLQKLAQHSLSDSVLRAFVDGCISRNRAYLATGKTQDVSGSSSHRSENTPVASPAVSIPIANEPLEYRGPDVEMDDLVQGDSTSPVQTQAGQDEVDSDSDGSVDEVSENWWKATTQDEPDLHAIDPAVDEDDGNHMGVVDDDSQLDSDSDSELAPGHEVNEKFFEIPAAVQKLRDTLRKGYTPPSEPPTYAPYSQDLPASELVSLRHFAAWVSSSGTVKAYNRHAYSLEKSTGVPVLSLHLVQQLAGDLVAFVPRKVDMCIQSCIAYTGDYAAMTTCPYVPGPGKPPCGQPRYRKTSSGRLKPRAVFPVLSPMATIKAMFANADFSRLLRARDALLQQALHLVGTAKAMYSDFGNSQVHMLHCTKLGLFKDSRDVAFAISTDGAQLTMKKQSNTWVMLLIILSLPADIRYKTSNVIINFATPGPKSPGDIESFLWVLFEDMAKASEGIWIWDAVDSAYFLFRAAIVMALGDMLGSAKLSGMAGHMALLGDRFTRMLAAKGFGKTCYYPLLAPQNEELNPGRPHYSTDNLPIRTQEHYWDTINRLTSAMTKKDETEITRTTGVSRLPLCAASPAFIHPSFFPLDPFHLFYENCMAFLWDTMTSPSSASEPIHFSKSAQLGALIPPAMETLPSSFCGPIRDIHLKRNSQYKIYEWMAVLHWYFIPIAIELSFNSLVLATLALFVEAIEFAMTVKPRDGNDLNHLHNLITRFLIDYERLFIANDPAKIVRARLCIFQLIHIPIHIQWNGSIRLGSQATAERAIGEKAHQIRSKKAPFKNLTNVIYQRELFKILILVYISKFWGVSRVLRSAP